MKVKKSTTSTFIPVSITIENSREGDLLLSVLNVGKRHMSNGGFLFSFKELNEIDYLLLALKAEGFREV